MKLNIISEVEAKKAEITISFSLENDNKPSVILSYECPACSGYGAMSRCSKCGSGVISEELDFKKINKMFDEKIVMKVKQTISKLYTDVCGTPIQPR